ncbi:MAG TPA: OmpA family protein, partial [Bacteroidia bacterium]|nr:OmpA family protein [Bacteroidia bacterium]
ATGREMWKTPVSARVTNLGANVNSSYPDYAPVVIYRSDILLFTSKRPGSTGNAKDDEGFFYEDIYQAKGESWNRWKEPSRYDTSAVKRRGIFSLLFNKAEVVSEINTEDHDGSITLSPDSTDLYIFRYGDIMKANWDGKRWQRPSRIGEEIDMRASHEPSIFLSRDGNIMFFVSDRKGGVGQKDIWICDKENGNWGKPHNLGLEVNTPFNEDSPFLSPDGMTLYFSSEGHNSMGGYDVFKCTRQKNGMWSQPENLGAPVNNGGDDIFYTPLENGAGAYYASLNREGEGDLDLFFVQYFPAVVPMAKLRLNANGLDPKDMVNIRISTPEGVLLNEVNLASTDSFMYPYNPFVATTYEISAPGFKKVTLNVENANTNEEQFMLQQLNITRNDSITQMSLVNYGFDIDSALNPVALADPFVEFPVMRTNYLDSLSSVNALTTRYTSSNTSGSGLSVDYFPPGTEFASLYFDFDRAELSATGKTETDKLVAWLQAHPGRKIEIIGHADENGDANYNQKLSEQRATAVKDALIAAGIKPDRIVTTGKGETEPAVDTRSQAEKTEDPGRMNRRVTIRILE